MTTTAEAATQPAAPPSAGPAVVGAESQRDLTGTLVALKLRVMYNAFARDGKLRIGMVVMTVLSLGGATFGFWSFLQRGARPDSAAMPTLVTGFTVIFGAWVFGPLLTGGVDETLDPTRLVLFPLHRSELRRGLLAGAFVGHVPIATFIALLGVVAGFSRSPISALIIFALISALLFLAMTASRSLATVLAGAARSRRGRDVGVILASVAGSVLWLGTQSLRYLADDDQIRQAVAAMRWFPPGLIADGIIEARAGQVSLPVIRGVGVTLLAVVLLQSWLTGLEKLLTAPEAVKGERIKNRTVPLLGGFTWMAGHPAGAVAMKEFRYLVRAPQRRSALIVGAIIGTPFAFILGIQYGGSTSVVLFAPVALLFGLGAANNLLGADAGALWIEITAGIRLRDLLLGRSLATIPYVIIPVLLSATLLAAVKGGWAQWLLIVTLSVLCWGIPLGVGCVVSYLAPFPQPDTGNPFANRRPTPGEGCLIGLIGVGALFLVGLLLLPVALVCALAWFRGPLAMLGALTVSTLWSLLVWFAGLHWAASRAQRNEAELIQSLGERRATR